jgi:hypothetical protein
MDFRKTMSRPEPHLEALAGHRVALVGFTEPYAKPLIDEIAAAGALSRFFSDVNALGERIESYDVVILNLASAWRDSSWISDRRLMCSKVPLLVAGSIE